MMQQLPLTMALALSLAVPILPPVIMISSQVVTTGHALSQAVLISMHAIMMLSHNVAPAIVYTEGAQIRLPTITICSPHVMMDLASISPAIHILLGLIKRLVSTTAMDLAIYIHKVILPSNTAVIAPYLN
jgi:hypothetical protein